MNRFVSLGELRLGLRLIARQPILSATIILALATGICLATMGFTFRDALLNSTLPYVILISFRHPVPGCPPRLS